MEQKPVIYEYNDFRAFLRDRYAFQHSRDKKFSKTRICHGLGLPNSRSYFQDVLNGKPVTSLKVPLFVKVFGLDADESRFFRALVNYNQSMSDPVEREMLFEQLIALNRTPKSVTLAEQYAYYKEWYHCVVRALLNITDFAADGDYLKLARMVFPPLTESRARESVALLLKLGLVSANSQGFLKPTQKVITTGAYAKDEILRQHQLKSLQISREAILKNRSLQQRVITKLISLSDEGYGRVVRKVEKFSAEVNAIVHKDGKPANRVCQLNIVLFPHTTRRNTP